MTIFFKTTMLLMMQNTVPLSPSFVARTVSGILQNVLDVDCGMEQVMNIPGFIDADAFGRSTLTEKFPLCESATGEISFISAVNVLSSEGICMVSGDPILKFTTSCS